MTDTPKTPDAGTTPTTTEAPAQAEAKHEPTKADLEYLASGTAPTVEIKPTTFEGEQPPGGHPQDPTSKGSVGSRREL